MTRHDGRYVVPFEDLRMTDVESVGGKNASLGEMISQIAHMGVRVPGGFATTALAFRDFLAGNGLTDRIDAGLAAGKTPGVDPEATPACVNACITQTLQFGDLDDPQSNVSQLLRENRHFRMHEELGTGPGFYYLWDAADTTGPAT